MTRFLSVAQVIALHDRALNRYGGKSGIRDQGALASAVAQPAMEAFGAELYPSLVEKAAAYLFFLARNHAFDDGNKRTAYASSAVFLLMNGLAFPDNDDGLFELVLESARGDLPDARAVAERIQELILIGNI